MISEHMKEGDKKNHFLSLNIDPSDIAKYYLYRSSLDGDLITPLKMQKMVYLAYAVHLAKKKEKLFKEPIEAWPNGPVVPSLYRALKKYGSSPVAEDFIDYQNQDELLQKFPAAVKETFDEVYEEYISKSAFELVTLTHQQKAWLAARKGLRDDQVSHNQIQDELILEQLGAK